MLTVSVIIPVFNGETHLKQCLDSILSQTLKEFEIICINDGSKDHSLDILKEYQKKDSRIIIIDQKNSGAGAARNAGLRKAKGKYLSFLDADDFFEPNMLENAVLCCEQFSADFVVFKSDQYHMDTNRFVATPWAFRSCDLPPYMPFSHRQLTGNIFKTFVGWAWDKLYRRSFIQEQELFFQEQRTSNDLYFVFSALVLAKRIAVVDEVLVHHRRGNSTSLSVTREKSWHCFYDALLALRDLLKSQNIYWELEQDYINYALHFSLWNLNTLAEPTKQLLKEKLCREWFENLGITQKPAQYFYSTSEYEQFKLLTEK